MFAQPSCTEGHIKNEHVTFELDGGENYLAQMIQCLITFIFLIQISSAYSPEAGKHIIPILSERRGEGKVSGLPKMIWRACDKK